MIYEMHKIIPTAEQAWLEYFKEKFLLPNWKRLDFWRLSFSSNITWEIVQAHPNEPWFWYGLSRNPNVTWEIVQRNPNKRWDWYGLSQNLNITWEIVQGNPDKPWDWHGLSQNPNITWEIVQENPDKPWDWASMRHNPNVTREIIQRNPDKPWGIARIPDKYQGWSKLSRDPNIRLDLIQENPNLWDWAELSWNSFTLEKQQFIRKWEAARTIQNWWQELQLNPYHWLGQQKIQQDYEFYLLLVRRV